MKFLTERKTQQITKYSVKIKTLEDVPMLWFNVRILKFWSVLIDNNWRQYFSYIPFFFLNIFQILDLYYTEKEINDKIHDTYMTMIIFNTFLRAIVMVTNRRKFSESLEYMKDLYAELIMEYDFEIRQIIRKYSDMVLKVSKINLTMGILTCVGFSMFPIMAEEREFIFGMYVPYLNEYQTPWYEILLAVQSVLNLSGMCTFIPFAGMFVSFLVFAMAISKVLQYKLSKLSTEISSKLAERQIIECIKLHLKLISFIDKVNELCSIIFLVDCILFVAILCIMLLSFILVKTVIQKCVIVVYMIMVFTQTFLLYYFSNETYHESLEISTAAYNIDWFNYDVETQKVLQLLLLRSQKPCAILIAKAYPINLVRLQAMLRVTYSVFTLLDKFYG
ncbi:odorant receptor 30a-like [Musca domestica]|uniref:Odorant receptor n=1 Tax=Musca domestica TaxID=7370 RepID=A0A9J7I8K7_MUSDO|nr:odorant receptor 30a-like [Musca domestica]